MPDVPTKRISVTLERELLDEIKQLAGKKTLSAVVNEALRAEARRLGWLAYFEEREREKPISPKGRAAGERLWKTVVLSLTPERSRRSRKTKTKSVSRSKKR
jgi:Arc/MetJ-type ribon-helix-helix transcriptional regulator